MQSARQDNEWTVSQRTSASRRTIRMDLVNLFYPIPSES